MEEGGAGDSNTHTQTHSVPRVTEGDGASARIGRNLDTCIHGPPHIKLMGYEHREDAVRGGLWGRRQWQTHTHTQCPS